MPRPGLGNLGTWQLAGRSAPRLSRAPVSPLFRLQSPPFFPSPQSQSQSPHIHGHAHHTTPFPVPGTARSCLWALINEHIRNVTCHKFACVAITHVSCGAAAGKLQSTSSHPPSPHVAPPHNLVTGVGATQCAIPGKFDNMPSM